LGPGVLHDTRTSGLRQIEQLETICFKAVLCNTLGDAVITLQVLSYSLRGVVAGGSSIDGSVTPVLIMWMLPTPVLIRWQRRPILDF